MSVQEYLTIREAAAYMRIGVKALKKLMREGEIPFRQFSPNRRMLLPADLDDWAESKRVQNPRAQRAAGR